MHKRYLVAGYRLFFAALTFVAVITQFLNIHQRPNFSELNFFSFFTIESNIFAAAIFALTGLVLLVNKKDDKWVMLRGAATLYMVITGIVYVLLLSGLEESLQTTLPWVNTVLHYLMPAVVLADWLVAPANRHINFKKALVWLGFPVAYVIYSLIRGPVANWYPYPFLNPTEHGYLSVGITSAAIALFALGITWLLTRVRLLPR
ncbi:Pr6Pr family membrane protein [Candidatus Saccharibacteria bacterium]|nr:Pr6Pr family membrane protein [Candidatus Saccharibacteria bacterium]